MVYGRETGFGFGIVHNNWIFRNGEILSQMVTTLARKYPRTEASLIVSLAVIKMPTFARCSEGRSHSNRKVNYELKRYSLVLVSWKLLLLLKSKNIVYRICSAHMSDEWTFQRAFVVEHNENSMSMKIWRTYVKNKIITITLNLYFFCIACSWKNSYRNCAFHSIFGII